MVFHSRIKRQFRQDLLFTPLYEQNGNLEQNSETINFLNDSLSLNLIALDLLHKDNHLLLNEAKIQISIVMLD